MINQDRGLIMIGVHSGEIVGLSLVKITIRRTMRLSGIGASKVTYDSSKYIRDHLARPANFDFRESASLAQGVSLPRRRE